MCGAKITIVVQLVGQVGKERRQAVWRYDGRKKVIYTEVFGLGRLRIVRCGADSKGV